MPNIPYIKNPSSYKAVNKRTPQTSVATKLDPPLGSPVGSELIWNYENQIYNKPDATVRVYSMSGLDDSNFKTNLFKDPTTGTTGEATQLQIEENAKFNQDKREQLVMIGILNEDMLRININNEFSNRGTDIFGSAVESIVDFTKNNSKLVSELQPRFKDVPILGQFLTAASNVQNIGLLYKNDVFKLFKRSDVELPSLRVDSLIYASDGWNLTNEEYLSGNPKSRVKKLISKFIGKDITSQFTGKNIVLDNFVLQGPPNGYRASLDGLEIGTFNLLCGNIIEFRHCIPNNISIQPSKYRLLKRNNTTENIRTPKGGTVKSSPLNEPLYYEVSVTFELSRRYFQEDLLGALGMIGIK